MAEKNVPSHEERARLNRELAQMLKGGVIMDVTTPEQARIAEAAGAFAVMALERIPADIRAAGGVSRMSDPAMIRGIQEAVSIPVMAKCRIGHITEAQILQAIDIDYIDESEVLSPADDVCHIDKTRFDVPFVCGARDLGEALRRVAEGATMIRTKGEPGTGDVVQAVRHMRKICRQIREVVSLREDELFEAARNLAVPVELVRYVHQNGKLPVVNFAAGGVAHPRRRRAHDAAWCRGRLRGLRHLQERQPRPACGRHRQGRCQLRGRRTYRQAIREPGRGHGRNQRRRDPAHHGGAWSLVAGTTAVLAVQGAFIEHERMLSRLGQRCVELRQASDLDQAFDRLVLPGGESTVQGKLLEELGMLDGLRRRIDEGMPVLATCAGLILLAARLDAHDDRGTPRLGTLDVLVQRNAYGRQLGSFRTKGKVAGIGLVPMTFIRAPYVMETGSGVEELAQVDGRIVAVRQGAQLALAFHPELDESTLIHEAFLAL